MNKAQAIFYPLLIVLSPVVLGIAGCNDSNDDGNPTTTNPSKQTEVNITVKNVAGQAVANATVKIGTAEVKTNAQGIAKFNAVENGKSYSATITATGYKSNSISFNLSAGQATFSQTVNLVVEPIGTVTARIFNTETGAPLANATISIGSVSVVTNADGDVTLNNIATGRSVLNVNSQGFAQQSIIINVIEGQPLTGVNIQLIPLKLAGIVNATTGGTVNLSDSTAQVVVGANSLVRDDGQPIVGSVSVYIAPINTDQDIRQMPGDLATIGSNGQRQPIESFGALVIKLVDSTGAAVSLKSGSTAKIRIPVVTRGTPLATVPLFIYDAIKGYWVQDGTGTLTLVSNAGDAYYTGTTSTFGTVNADKPYQPITVTGCLADEAGNRLKNAMVSIEGINYSGYTTANTNANGEFSIEARPDSILVVTGQQGRLISNSTKITTGSSNYNLPSCLAVTNVSSNVTVRLTWGRLPEDVDSHLFAPDGTLVYFDNFGSLQTAPYANLDVDDIDSFGPEIVTVRRLMVGDYQYVVHNYSETSSPALTQSPIRVELNTSLGSQVFLPNAGEVVTGNKTYFWHAFTLKVDATCKITIVPVKQWLASDDQLKAPNNTPTYCTPAS